MKASLQLCILFLTHSQTSQSVFPKCFSKCNVFHGKNTSLDTAVKNFEKLLLLVLKKYCYSCVARWICCLWIFFSFFFLVHLHFLDLLSYLFKKTNKNPLLEELSF